MKSNINLLNQRAANGASAVSVSVVLRDGLGIQIIDMVVQDNDDVVVRCIQIFNKNPINDSINLQPENILLLQADGNSTLKAVAIDDIPNWFPKPNEMYFAIERFSVVPEDLFRTVEIKQIEPATYSNPQYVPDGSRSFSKASPLFCAAMKDDEWKTPSYILHKKKAMPRGISLFLENTTVQSHDKFVDPFRAIASDEKTNTETVMPLEVLKDYIDNAGIESDPSFGRLKTSVTHDDNKDLKLFVGGKKLATNKTNKKPLANKRDVYWRFKLAKGTDLRPFGMEVVYDCHSPRHWTLIRTSFHDPSPAWTHPSGSKLLVPYYRLQDDIDLTTNDGIRDMLRPFDDTDTRKEPETLGEMTDGSAYLVCPKVAALFGFHDLLMKASAEPVPLGFDDPDSQESVLCQALRVLYYECSEPDVQTIIEDLASANYDPEEIGVICKDTLIKKMIDLVGDFAGDDDLESDADSNEESGDSLDATAKEMLVKAIEMLQRSSPGRPMATPGACLVQSFCHD